MKNNISRNIMYLVLTTILCFVFTMLLPFELLGERNELIRLLAGLFLLLFVVSHGLERYGYEKLVLFMCISVLVSFSFESLSINTGFPFGHFYYTELLGPKISEVPATILPAYGLTGYLAFNMATFFVGNFSRGIKKNHIVIVPIIAACMMVIWNLCFDPIFSTIDGKWIWINGGSYFGVPLSNFLGWFLTNYIIFQIATLYLYKYGNITRMKSSPYFYYVVPIMFFIQGIPYLIYPFIKVKNTIIYQSMFAMTVAVMGVISVICVLMIKKQFKKVV